MQKIWAVMVCMDQTEGRGPSEVRAHFTKEEDAKNCLNGQIGSVSSFELYSSLDDYKLGQLNDIKRRALSKLTAEERKALNL